MSTKPVPARFVMWIEVERTKSPVLFRLSLKLGDRPFSKPRVVTGLQVVGAVAKWLQNAVIEAL